MQVDGASLSPTDPARRADRTGGPAPAASSRIAAARTRLRGAKVGLTAAATVAFGAALLLARATSAGGSGRTRAPGPASLAAPKAFLAALGSGGEGRDFGAGGALAPAQSPPQVRSGGS